MNRITGTGLIGRKNNILNISIETDENNIIRDIKFKAFGNWEIEYILEKIKIETIFLSIENILTITATDIIDSFSLQEENYDYAIIIEEALRKSAIECLKQQIYQPTYHYDETE